MADGDRIVYPDEVEAVRAAAEKQAAGKEVESNSVEETPAQPAIAMRNMVVVPDNCPPGFKKGADGVCREVFD